LAWFDTVEAFGEHSSAIVGHSDAVIARIGILCVLRSRFQCFIAAIRPFPEAEYP
jgi:hypothetical protein